MINMTDLSGVWELALCKEQSQKPLYSDSMTLPGTTSAANKGEYNPARETGFLTDTYPFEGYAWYRRKVTVTGVSGKTVKIFLERTRITTLYIDSEEVGREESLVSPHVYDVTGILDDGEHEITVCVANVGYKTPGGHLTSADTQTNWNGIVGRMEIQVYEPCHAENVMITSDVQAAAFKISADITGAEDVNVKISARSFNGEKIHCPLPAEYVCSGGRLECVYPLGEGALLWSEFEPNLYELTIDVGGDVSVFTVGLRDFKSRDGKFEINGRTTFLRGKHDGMIFPKTGYAPTDLDEWLRVMSIAKSYGINHYRYHTCCPPEAAFEAADRLGIYMEPQLPFWGTIQAPDEEGFNGEEQDFLIGEGFNMLRAFGNHPSYCMMSMGNELWGSCERINDIIGGYKAFDSRHLYTQGSNNFQWYPNVVPNDDYFVGVRLAKNRLIRGSYAMCDAPLGHVQTDKPGTMHDYDKAVRPDRSAEAVQASADGTVQIQFGTTMKTVKASDADADFIPQVPIVTHEIGQYETYPDFKEIEKYTGPLRARNFEVFRERLDEKGLLPLAQDYFECSGRLAVQCYKEELEAAFRSRSIAGFQLLDIQDFTGQGTALVGILDAFMDSKGLVSPEEWRQFCSDAVIMARFDSYTLQAGDIFRAHLELAYFRASDINGSTVKWQLAGEDLSGAQGECIVRGEGNYFDLCDIEVRLPDLEKPQKYTLSLCVEGTDIKNSYELTVFPQRAAENAPEGYVFTSAEDARGVLENGGTALIFQPRESAAEGSIDGFYCQDFWCYHMFRAISEMMEKPEPVGTMGLLIDKDHAALAQFPSDKWSEPQWWEIVSNSYSEILDEHAQGKKIIVQTIDNFERNHRLGLLYEYEIYGGRAVVCCCDPKKLELSFEGRQFLHSLYEYVKSCGKK